MAKKLDKGVSTELKEDKGVSAVYDADLANVADMLAQETFDKQQYTEWKLQREAEQEEFLEKNPDILKEKGGFVQNSLYGKDVMSDDPTKEEKPEPEATEQPAQNRKFELVPENVKEVDGRTLYQIRALQDIETAQGTVHSGELGGWVEKPENLSAHGNAWIDPTSQAYGDAVVKDDAYLGRGATIRDNAVLKDKATAIGPKPGFADLDMNLEGNGIPLTGFIGKEGKQLGITVEQPQGPIISGNAVVEGYADIRDRANVGNFARVSDHARVVDDAQVLDNAQVSGHALLRDKSIASEETYIGERAMLMNDSRADGSSYIAGEAELRGQSHVGGMTELRDKVNDFLHLDNITLGGKAELADAEHTVYDSQRDVNMKNFKDGLHNMVEGGKTFWNNLTGKMNNPEAEKPQAEGSRGSIAEAKFGDLIQQGGEALSKGSADMEK